MAATVSLRSIRIPQQRWLLFGVLLFFAAINVQYLFKVRKLDSVESADRSAIQRWLPQLHDFTKGENIWEKHNFPCPPIMALILAPLTLVPHGMAAVIWFTVKAAMALACIYLVFAMVEDSERPFPFWGKVLTLILSARAFQGDLVHGNVNLLILMLVIAALFAFTRGRDVTAGLTLGLAIACKLTPALFVPYFLWKRAWRTAAATFVGLALFALVVPSLFGTWSDNWSNLSSWYAHMAQPFLTKGDVLYSKHTNQSLPAVAERLLTRSPSFTHYEDGAYQPLEYHNFADLDPRFVDWLVRGVMILFALAVMWTCRTPLSQRRAWPMAAEFGVILIGMLLFSERTWKHHCVTLLLPFAVLAYLLTTRWQERGLRWFLIATLGLTNAFMTAASTGLFDGHDRAGKLAQAYGAYTWAFLLLAAALMGLIARSRRDLKVHGLRIGFVPSHPLGQRRETYFRV
ncbi:MAG: DUF2029 domain-containing protein [Planctomycetes bacterium]|nr:DUF2029 domain-containing protein [Planctomycetota bacterium]